MSKNLKWAPLVAPLLVAWPAMAEELVVQNSEQVRMTIDTSTIRRYGNLLRYRSVEVNRRWNREVVEDVLADCAERQRGNYTSGGRYSVYPNTRNGDEVDAACSYAEKAGILPVELARARPPTIEAKAEVKPVAPPEPKVSSSGSGFFVTSAQVVTNYHVVEGCKRFTVRRDTSTFDASLQATTDRNDLALLKVDTVVSSLPVLRPSAALGEDIMIAGHPLANILGHDLIVASGQVNSLAGLNNDPSILQISAPVQPGNSGGPVIDRAGNIVGVVVAKVNVLKLASVTGDFAQNVNFAIKPEVLRMFLDANRVQYKSAPATKRLDGAELAERARNFTVQVLCSS